jgi:nitrite reductase (NAD(P)H)
MFYIRTADKLQRTARWIENLPGGIAYLRDVIINDSLGICAELEAQMSVLVGSFFDEWAGVLTDPTQRANFRQFANTAETVETVETVVERGQERPTYWANEAAKEDFRATKWSSLTWQPLVSAAAFTEDGPSGASVNVKRGDTQLAVFKVKGKYYATQQMCPHKRAFVLSDGLIGDELKTGRLWVSCPYHRRNFELAGKQAGRCSNDEALSIATFPVEERDDGMVYVKLPPVEELDAVLGTSRWIVKKEESDKPFEKLDRKLKGMRAQKPLSETSLTSNGVKTITVGGRDRQAVGSIDW